MMPSLPNNQNIHSKVNHRRRLALLLLGSFFATQAAQHPGNLFNFRRLIPPRRHLDSDDSNSNSNCDDNDQCENTDVCRNPASTIHESISSTASSAVQSLVEGSLTVKHNAVSALTSYRGGYQDELIVAADADAVAVAVGSQEVQLVQTSNEEAERIDLDAKSKEYGELEFSLFQKGDGSDEDPEGIPDRYLRMQMQDRDKAKTACRLTLAWRAEYGIDHILRDPHPDFDVCKAVFPHSFVARDVEGHMVFLQRPALINFDLSHKNGLEKEQLLGECKTQTTGTMRIMYMLRIESSGC